MVDILSFWAECPSGRTPRQTCDNVEYIIYACYDMEYLFDIEDLLYCSK